jgi:hypothetical protein
MFSGEAEGAGAMVGEKVGEGEAVVGVCVGGGRIVDVAGESFESGGTVRGVDVWEVSVFVGLSVGFDAGFRGWLTTMADATVINEQVRTTAITMTVLFIALKLAQFVFT